MSRDEDENHPLDSRSRLEIHNEYIEYYTNRLNMIDDYLCDYYSPIYINSTHVVHLIPKSASLSLITSCFGRMQKNGGILAPDCVIIPNCNRSDIVAKIAAVLFDIIMCSGDLLLIDKFVVDSYISLLDHFINTNGNLFDSSIGFFSLHEDLSVHKTTTVMRILLLGLERFRDESWPSTAPTRPQVGSVAGVNAGPTNASRWSEHFPTDTVTAEGGQTNASRWSEVMSDTETRKRVYGHMTLRPL